MRSSFPPTAAPTLSPSAEPSARPTDAAATPFFTVYLVLVCVLAPVGCLCCTCLCCLAYRYAKVNHLIGKGSGMRLRGKGLGRKRKRLAPTQRSVRTPRRVEEGRGSPSGSDSSPGSVDEGDVYVALDEAGPGAGSGASSEACSSSFFDEEGSEDPSEYDEFHRRKAVSARRGKLPRLV